MTKLREALNKAKSNEPPNPNNEHRRRFESAINSLPETMTKVLETELKFCKNDITQRVLDLENQLKTSFESENVKKMRGIVEEYQRAESMHTFLNKGTQIVLKQNQEIVSTINNNLKQNKIREALSYLKKLHEYKRELGNVVRDIIQAYAEVLCRIRTIFDSTSAYFINHFLKMKIFEVSSEEVTQAEKSLFHLIEFAKFTDDLKSDRDWFSNDFNLKILGWEEIFGIFLKILFVFFLIQEWRMYAPYLLATLC